MIAVTAALEQISATPKDFDFPQINEPVEKSDKSDKSDKPENQETGRFSELLAGLLRDSEYNREYIAAKDISLEDNLIDDKQGIEKLHLLKITPLSENNEKPFAEDVVALENGEALTETKKLFASLGETAQEANDGDFYRELSNLIKEDLIPEAQLSENNLIYNADRNVQAVHGSQDASAEINAKKERVLNSALNNAQNSAQKASFADGNEEAVAGKKARTEENAGIKMQEFRLQNEKTGKLDEARSSILRDRSKSGKTVSGTGESSTGQTRSMTTNVFSAAEAGAGRQTGETNVREFTLELRLPEQNNSIQEAATSWEAKSSGALENLLARELHQNFNGDIVRHASMALKDGGEGIIKLALKPESLGNVKIALELADNKITGKILVESEEALNAFRKEITSLEKEFKDSGFTSANLNLSLASEEQNTEGWENNQAMPKYFALRYEENTEKLDAENAFSLINVYFGHRRSSINMLA